MRFLRDYYISSVSIICSSSASASERTGQRLEHRHPLLQHRRIVITHTARVTDHPAICDRDTIGDEELLTDNLFLTDFEWRDDLLL
jgi:hypothetical protein